MNKLGSLILLLGIVVSQALQAQDTIIFNNGDELRVKVTEVSDSEIKYQLWSNKSGPTYVKKLSDVFLVKYKGGGKEVYGKKAGVGGQRGDVVTTVGADPADAIGNISGRLERNGNRLLLDGCELDDVRMRTLLGEDQFARYKAASVMRNFGLDLTYWGGSNLVYAAIFLPLGLALGVDWVWISATVLAVAGAIELPFGIVVLTVNTKRLNDIADRFNQRQGLTMSFYPTAFTVEGLTKPNQPAFGTGITLSF